MPSGPSKILQELAKALIPAACREEVLGDLYERYKSPAQYLGDLLSTLPFVVLCRVRRTTNIRLLLMDALLVYGSFLAAAWYVARTLVTDEGGLVRLAIPSGLTLLALLISDAFAGPLRKTASDWIRSLVIKIGLATLCWAVATRADYFGLVLSFMLVSTARLLFEPGARQPQGVEGAALLAGRESRPVSRTSKVTMTLFSLAVIGWVWWEILSRRAVHP